jgi:hypothetical protein
VKWLEDEVSGLLGIDCKSLKTGTPLKHLIKNGTSDENPRGSNALQVPGLGNILPTGYIPLPDLHENVRTSKNSLQTGEISVLSLRSTADMHDVDSASGFFFKSYASHLAHSFGCSRAASLNEPNWNATLRTLTPETIILLLRSFQMWVQPLYPLLHHADLERLGVKYSDPQTLSTDDHPKDGDSDPDELVFCLVMALGAVCLPNTTKELRESPSREVQQSVNPIMCSANSIFSRALHLFDRCDGQGSRPTLGMIQCMLLVSIYGMYAPIGSSQWQLTGLAMRVCDLNYRLKLS